MTEQVPLTTHDAQGLDVAISEVVEARDIERLMSGEIYAIQVPGFLPPQMCEEITRRLPREGFGPHSSFVSNGCRYGDTSFAAACVSYEKLEAYYASAAATMRKIRRALTPYLGPMDKLRLELDEGWPHGALIERVHPGHPMVAGSPRWLPPDDRGFFPHVDALAWQVVSPVAGPLTGQIGANVYCTVPDQGGELNLWRRQLTAEEATELHTWGKSRQEKELSEFKERIGPPQLTIKPECGDLVLMNCLNVHSVNPGTGDRVTFGCFIGYRGVHKPLTVWS